MIKVCFGLFGVVLKDEMKCFLCSFNFDNQKDLLNHYISYHTVDESNWFFQKLFQVKNKFVLKNCVRCKGFLTTEKHQSIHNFLKHYEEGKATPFEDKPTDVLKSFGLTIYSIEFKKHKDSYGFFNSERCVDDFLKNVRYRFKVTGKKWIKCSFTIENIQNSPHEDLIPIINSRYWTTPPYEGIYFNDFIFYGLRQSILSKVIINGMSGSSWHFKHSISLSVKILDNNVEAVI